MSERRRLLAVDDPLDLDEAPSKPAPPRAKPRADAEQRALFVRLPADRYADLARAAFELGVHKRRLVAALVDAYVDPSPEGLAALRTLLEERSGSPDGRRSG